MGARSFGDDCSSSLTSLTDAAAGITTDDNPGSTKAARRPITSDSASASASSPKRSRRSAEKRVVNFPISEVDGSRPKGEGAPPSDSWAWRKYGQKPIKGSPYPRGYYRCSSSKGCPARKQVERSRADPTMLVVTYSCDHNHPWPLPKNHSQQKSPSVDAAASAASCSKLRSPEEEEEDLTAGVVQFCSPRDPCDRFSDLISEEASLHGEYCWFSEVGSASPSGSTDDLLLGSITEAAGVCMVLPDDLFRAGGDEEESLFAGLGELPECSVVFRRSYLERQMLEQEEGLAAALR